MGDNPGSLSRGMPMLVWGLEENVKTHFGHKEKYRKVPPAKPVSAEKNLCDSESDGTWTKQPRYQYVSHWIVIDKTATLSVCITLNSHLSFPDSTCIPQGDHYSNVIVKQIATVRKNPWTITFTTKAKNLNGKSNPFRNLSWKLWFQYSRLNTCLALKSTEKNDTHIYSESDKTILIRHMHQSIIWHQNRYFFLTNSKCIFSNASSISKRRYASLWTSVFNPTVLECLVQNKWNNGALLISRGGITSEHLRVQPHSVRMSCTK